MLHLGMYGMAEFEGKRPMPNGVRRRANVEFLLPSGRARRRSKCRSGSRKQMDIVDVLETVADLREDGSGLAVVVRRVHFAEDPWTVAG